VGSLETPVNKVAFRELSDVPRQKVREIEHFFLSYNEAQGRQLKISGRGGSKSAERILASALQSDEG
jgi:inorganic pyrophosphatase